MQCVIILFYYAAFLELQNKLEMTLKEKSQAFSDLEAVREELREAKEEVSLNLQLFIFVYYCYCNTRAIKDINSGSQLLLENATFLLPV